MIDVNELKQQASGKWFGILQSLGIDVRSDDKHSRCPLGCGDDNGGKDRFRLDRDGSGYLCGQCSSGDALKLIQGVFSISFTESLERVAKIVGVVDMDKIENKTNGDARKGLNTLWKNSRPLTKSDMVCHYLKLRFILPVSLELLKDIRFCPNCYESETKTKMPAMVALIRDHNGKPVSIHRTYLDKGGKANIVSPRKLMPPAGELKGSAIRLLPQKGDLVGVAEGIETALACAKLHRIPTWSAINSILMESWVPPEGIKRVIIFADNDKTHTGQRAAHILANRLYVYNNCVVEVLTPDLPGDWADELEAHEKVKISNK